jgi:hypothetical protein
MVSILDTRRMVGDLTNLLLRMLVQGMAYTFVLMLLRVLLRRQWLAAGVLVLLFGLLTASASSHPGIEATLGALSMAGFAMALLRFGGLLTSIVCGFVGVMLAQEPLTTDFSAWYASPTIFAVVVVLALAGYAFHTAVAGRPLFKAGFLEPT